MKVRKFLMAALIGIAFALPTNLIADGPPTHCPGWSNHVIPPGWAQPGPRSLWDEFWQFLPFF